MIVVIIVVLILWYLMGDGDFDKPMSLLCIGLIVTYVIAVMASLVPITDIPLGDNEAVRVYP